MIVSIEHNKGLVQQAIDIFIKAVNKKLDESSDVIKPEFRKMINICPISNTTHYIGELIDMRNKDKTYTVKELMDKYMNWVLEWGSKPYLTKVHYVCDENARMHIVGIEIVIKVDVVYVQVLDNLEDIDTVFEVYAADACHEVGHIMDNILLMENTDINEYNTKFGIPDAEAYKEYYKWCEEFSETLDPNKYDIEANSLISKKYYQLPAESRADILGGVDREALLNKLKSKLRDKCKLRIEVVE